MYSTVTGSSIVNLNDWHSILAILTNTRASAFKPYKLLLRLQHKLLYFFKKLKKQLYNSFSPAKAITMWSSSKFIFRKVLSSCNFGTDFFSTPITIQSFPRTPTYISKNQEAFSTKKLRKTVEVERFFLLNYCGRSLFYGFLSIFDLKQMSIRRKYRNSTVVTIHLSKFRRKLLTESENGTFNY